MYLLVCVTYTKEKSKIIGFKLFERQDLVICSKVFEDSNLTPKTIITYEIRFFFLYTELQKKLLVQISFDTYLL